MVNKYGFWATLIDVGRNPRLSAFWRRRMTMHVSASRTSPVLSLKNMLMLVTAGMLFCVMPTFFFVPAAADEGKTTVGNGTLIIKGRSVYDSTDAKPGDETAPAKAQAERKQSTLSFVTVTGTFSGEQGDYIYIPVYVYIDLARGETRKELNFSSEQEKKLREMSGNYSKQMQEVRKEWQKEAENLSPQKQITTQRKYQTKLSAQKNSLRKQIDKLLTPEQSAALKSKVIGMSFGRLLMDPQLRDKIGLSEEQKNQLTRINEGEGQKEKYEQLGKSLEENGQESLAVLTPQQWEEIGSIVGNSEDGINAIFPAGMFVSSYPDLEVMELQNPELRKELSLSAEQQTKLQEIYDNSQTQAAEISKLSQQTQSLLSTKEQENKQAAKQDELHRKMKEAIQNDREQIAAVLTPEQLEAFKKTSLQHNFMNSLEMSGFFGGGIAGRQQPGILDRINASQEQKDELRRLHAEKERLMQQNYRETGEKALKILNPQQQEKFFDELDRQVFNQDSNESKSLSKTGGGSLIVSGKDTYTVATKPAGKASQPDGKNASNYSGGTLVLSSTANISSKGGSGSLTVSGGTGGPLSIYSMATTTSDEYESPESDRSFAFGFYSPLVYDRYRKELGLTSEQENKLQAIHQNYQAELQRQNPVRNAKWKEINKLPEKERMAKISEMNSQEIKPVRKQVDQVLTSEQLTALKNIMLCKGSEWGWFLGGDWAKKIGMTNEQEIEFYKNHYQRQNETYANIKQLERETDEKFLDVLSPQQREDLERQVGATDYVQSAIFGKLGLSFTPSTGIARADYPVLFEPDVSKELDLSPEQLKKINAILESQPSQEIYKLSKQKQPEGGGTANITAGFNFGNSKDIKEKNPELQRKSEEMEKQLREQIEAVFTAQQLETLNKIALFKEVVRSFKNPRILEEIKITDQQKEALRRLREERAWISIQLRYEESKKSIDRLSPQQRQKLIQELDRKEWSNL